ncbi:MAG: cbb3-type cytochrome oxidase assembly protein CcoS [Chlorobi bacterium]|nr:cbb3-type cytochrome oxidase assembly protein CcoS [Chlorobiota bacterium]
MDSIYYLIIIGFIFGTAAWLLFIWAVRSGQFDDPEAPKYRMLDDDDEQPEIRRKKEPLNPNKHRSP